MPLKYIFQISCETIFKYFNNDGCPNLKGKPKFFIIQACRGDLKDKGVFSEDGKPFRHTEAQSRSPSWGDMLILYSTIPGYVSIRHETHGSILVNALCKTFRDYSHFTHLEDMLKKTNQALVDIMADKNFHFQCSSYENRGFNKNLYFNHNREKTQCIWRNHTNSPINYSYSS